MWLLIAGRHGSSNVSVHELHMHAASNLNLITLVNFGVAKY